MSSLINNSNDNNSNTKNPPSTAAAASSSSLPSSLSEHLNQCLKTTFLEQQRDDSNNNSSNTSTTTRTSLSSPSQQQPQQQQSLLILAAQTTDAYVSLQGPYCQAHLPTLDWNQQFRKAYTLLMWIRPRWMCEKKKKKSSSSSDAAAAAGDIDANDVDNVDPNESTHETETTTTTTTPRILYRFATDPDDAKAVGVAVTCSQWKVVYNDNDDDRKNTSGDDKKDSNNNANNKSCCYLETTLTAYTLPHHKPSKVVAAGTATYSSWVQVPLRLKMPTLSEHDSDDDEAATAAADWHLLSFSHVFPYLKRPCWTVTLDGLEVGSGELQYPLLNVVQQQQQSQDQQTQPQQQQHVVQTSKKKSMEYNYLLHHVVTPAVVDTKNESSTSTTTTTSTTRPWQLDLAAVSLYPEHIPANLQALCAEAGPNLCLQTADGRILPTLPPVCNWCVYISVCVCVCGCVWLCIALMWIKRNGKVRF